MVLDFCIIIALIFFIINGYKKGFVKSVYSILSLVITVILVSVFKESFIDVVSKAPVALSIGEFFSGKTGDEKLALLCSEKIIYLASTILLYILIRIASKFGFKIINSIASLPIINTLNKMLGIIIGAITGVIWIVIILNVLDVIPQTMEYVQNSSIVEYFNLILI